MPPARPRALLEKVRLPDAEALLDRYPHQLSGGMRQRVMIAMALSCQPRLLIADEPTTALDVTIQAQILNTVRALQRDLGTAVIFITHDMGVVAEMADDVVVMLRGKKVEQGTVEEIFRAPKHPYTRALLAAVPRLGSLTGRDLPLRTPQTVLEDGELREVGETRDQDTARYDEPVLRVEKLTTRFDVGHNLFGRVTHRVHAVEEVSFDVYPGETLALVGESGSGKSTIGKTLQQLIAPTGGAVRYNGQDIFSMDSAGRQRLRQEIQYIFQDPYASLDPRKTVAFSIAEPIRTHGLLSDEAAIARRVGELLEQVGLKPEHAARYPHEFSGGQRQRVCIARALASNQAHHRRRIGVGAGRVDPGADPEPADGPAEGSWPVYLFITHDMAVVEKVSHRVAVLYLGQIVELGTRRQIFESPQHAYTRKLLAAVPVAEPGRHIDTSLIEGEIPSPVRRVGDEPAIIPWPSSRPATWSPARPDSLTSAHSRPWRRPCISSARPSPPPRWPGPGRRPARRARRRHAQRGHQPGSGQLGPYRHLRDLLGLGGQQPVRQPDHARRRPEAATRPGHQVGIPGRQQAPALHAAPGRQVP